MNNNERLVDDNSTVSIQDNEKESPMEIPKAEKQKKSSITIRELTIIGLLAGITIALGLSGTTQCNNTTCTNIDWCHCRRS